jgi:putative methylase
LAKIKRKDLEIFLQQLDPISSPKLALEQYPTPARVAANILWLAGIEHFDIANARVVDLGCGAGILAIGAAYLGAKEAIGIDIDFSLVKLAAKNSRKATVEHSCHWLCMDINDCYLKPVDTVIMNPPFGMRKESQTRDRFFVKKALEFSSVVYSVLPYAEKTRVFYQKYLKGLNAKIDTIIQTDFEIWQQFAFHSKRKHVIKTDLYRITKD